MCTINDYDIIWILRYGAWWTEFSVILDHFLPFYPNNPKNENTTWRYHFTLVYTPQMTLHICIWGIAHEIWSVTTRIFCHFVTALLLPWKPEKIKILKKWKKKSWRYHHLTQMYQKSWSYPRPFLRYNACPHKKTSQDLTEN